MADTFVFKGFLYDEDKILAKRNLEMGGAVQKFIDSEVLRLCEPLVPFDQGTLARSGQINTVIGSGQVKYRTPYARRWYYMRQLCRPIFRKHHGAGTTGSTA